MDGNFLEMLFINHISLVVGITYKTLVEIVVGQGKGLSILLMTFMYYVLIYHNPVFKDFVEQVKDKYRKGKGGK